MHCVLKVSIKIYIHSIKTTINIMKTRGISVAGGHQRSNHIHEPCYITARYTAWKITSTCTYAQTSSHPELWTMAYRPVPNFKQTNWTPWMLNNLHEQCLNLRNLFSVLWLCNNCSKCCSEPLLLQLLHKHLVENHCDWQTAQLQGVSSNLWVSCYLWAGLGSSTTNHLLMFNIPCCILRGTVLKIPEYSPRPLPTMCSIFMCSI